MVDGRRSMAKADSVASGQWSAKADFSLRGDYNPTG
jgi:hypothetical protein